MSIIIKFISRVVRLSIIIVFVVFASSYIEKIENRTYSDNINKNVNLSTMALKVDEFKANDIYSAKDTYTGDLTGYVFNCPLCGGTLGCLPTYNIKDGTTTYNDDDYGNINIVASSTNLSCGTVVRINNGHGSNEPIYAIVLDRGVRGNALDLLSKSVEDAYTLGRKVITYDVLREGWGE